MEIRQITILKALSSENRCMILKYISEGVGHPDDIASKINASRQAVDKQLGVLYETGLIEKKAITPPSGRPKVVFNITKSGKTLIHDIDNFLHKYITALDKELKHEIEDMDTLLLKGEINEEVYHKRNNELRKRYKILTEEQSESL